MDIDEIKKITSDIEEKYGWYMHCVVDDNNVTIECHTHRLLVKFGKLDMQVVANPTINTPDKCKKLLNDLVRYMSINDKTFIDSMEVTPEDLNINFNITFKLVQDEFGMVILRGIISDNNGLYPWDDGCDPRYAKQFTNTDVVTNHNLATM